jgi:hypothetical protein
MPNNVARQCAHSPGLDSLLDARHASTNDEFMATDQERATNLRRHIIGIDVITLSAAGAGRPWS